MSRPDIEGYQSCARQLDNFLIGYLGEAYRRGGTTVVAKGSSPYRRVIPFYVGEKSYIICFKEGLITSSRSSGKSDCQNVDIFNVTDLDLKTQTLEDLRGGKFLPQEPCSVFGEGAQDELSLYDSYVTDVGDGYSEAELLSMDYTQIGTVLICTGKSFPPFVIRHERDEFVYYRNFLELVKNGDAEELPLEAKAIFSLPYSYYGFGLDFRDISRRSSDGTYYFEAYLTSKENFDSTLLSPRNLRFWRNRGFILSAQKEDPPEVTNPSVDDSAFVFGGVIHSIDRSSSGRASFAGSSSGYLVKGELNVSERDQLNDLDVDQTVLFLCDWSERLGFPKAVSSYENRICFANNEAFPSKFWYSAVPGVRRLQVATRRETAGGTQVQNTFSIDRPIYRYVFRDQLTFFDRESTALGLALSDSASPGSIFINDNLGFSIQWLKSGEVLYVGTNQGVFISSGTNASSSSVTPFNEGFRKPVDVPVKDVRPELISRTLYFLSDDNKLKSISYTSEKGYTLESLDEVLDPIIQDPSLVVPQEKRSIIRQASIGRDLQLFDSGILFGETVLDVHTPAGKTTDNCEGDVCVSDSFFSLLSEPDTITEQTSHIGGLLYFSQNYSRNLSAKNTNRSSLFLDKIERTFRDLSKYSQNFLISGMLSSLILEDLSAEDIASMTYHFSFLTRLENLDTSSLATEFIPDTITYKDSVNYGSSIENSFNLIDAVDAPNDGNAGVDYRRRVNSFIRGEISNGFVKRSHSLDEVRFCGLDYTPAVEAVDADMDANPPVEAVAAQDAKLKFYFDGDVLGAGVKRIEFAYSTSNYSFTFPNDATLTDETSSVSGSFLDFGSDATVVKSYEVQMSEISGAIFNSNGNITVNFFDANNVQLASRQIKLEQFVHGGVSLQTFRDNISLDYSGRFEISYGSIPVYADAVTSTLDTSAIQTLRMTVESAINATASRWNVTLDGVSSQEQIEGVPSSVGTTSVTSQEEALVYSLDIPNTEILYDWTKKALFIFRKGAGYLSLCLNPETGVKGWTAGSLDLGNPTYVRNIRFNSPESYPSIFGTDKDGRVVLFTQGLYNGSLAYVDNLPNCLDSHILFKFNEEDQMLNYDDLRFRLLELNFKADDIVTLADSKTIIRDKIRVGDLAGSEHLPSSEGNFVIGFPYKSTLVNFMPLAQDRRNSTFSVGSKIALSNLTLHFMFASEFELNGKLVKKFEIDPRVHYERFGTFFQEVIVESFHSYDPLLELAIETPNPFSIGGYSVEVNVGGSN